MQAERYHAKDGKGDDRPKDYHDGYLLLTTKETCSKFAKKFEYNGQIHDGKKHGVWKTGSRSCLIFGTAMIDESHEEYFEKMVFPNIPIRTDAKNCSRSGDWSEFELVPCS